MASNEPKVKSDGMISFLGGQNSGISPNLIRPDQCSQLWNITIRGGRPKSRPGWKEIELSFPNTAIRDWFADHHVQGCKEFHNVGNNEVRHIWSVGGRFFAIDLIGGNKVVEITPTRNTTTTSGFTIPAVGSTVVVIVSDPDLIPTGTEIKIDGKYYTVESKTGSSLTVTNIDGIPTTVMSSGASVIYLDVNSPTQGICYMIQAEDFLIAQDGLSKPFIYDGATSRRSKTEIREVPTGTVMGYSKGRLWVATRGDEYVASDIVYGPTGTADYEYRDAILRFTENSLLTGGGSFKAPGRITAMQPSTVLDVSNAQGPLMIFTETSIISVDAPTSRDLWATMTNPIVATSLVANGATSFYGTVPTVNGDIFYRAVDGLRSFFVARREFGTWGNTPISREISNLTNLDAINLLQYTSAIVFDNRLLFTGASMPSQYGAKWRGLGVLDFDGISSMFSKTPPAYDGVWTGIDVKWIYTATYGLEERAFMAVINADNKNELWELSKDSKFDNDGGRIKSRLYSKDFSFDSPFEIKRIEGCEIAPTEVVGQVDYTLRYRPDNYPCWYSWHTQPVCANYKRCTDASCDDPPQNFRAGYKTRIPFGQPPDTDELNDGKPARNGYTHQVCLTWEGHCAVKTIRLKAVQLDDTPTPFVDIDESCRTLDCCEDDNFEWRSATATESEGDV